MNKNNHILSKFIILLIIVGCNQQQEESNKVQTTITQTVNGTYTYTETGGVYSSVTIMDSNWYGSLKICDYCDSERESGVVRDNTLYDSSGFVQVGTVSNGTLRMRMGTGTATHRK